MFDTILDIIMQLLSDNPSENDTLGFEQMSKILQDVIQDMPHPPFTIGIFGEWGCGKTTLMKMVEERLKNNKFKTVWFNAWKYDGKEVLWNALIQQIFYTMKNDSEWRDREGAKECKEKIHEIAINLARYTAKVATRFVPGGLLKEEDVDLLLPLNAEDPEFDFINRFESDFDDLVNSYIGKGGGRLVVFIDDLDRCLPENAIAVMEALKLYLDRANCIFVIGTEISIIEEGIQQRYNEKNTRLSAKNYLEKIIQLPFIMRGIEPKNALSLLSDYTTILNYDNPIIKNLIIEGTKCNPRRIKRFLNAFWVLSNIASYEFNISEEPQQLDIEQQQQLALILLTQMIFPKLYYAFVNDLSLISGITSIYNIDDPDRRQELLREKSEEFKEFYHDQKIRSFLLKAKDIPCKKPEIQKWVVLTKGQAFATGS